jgi:Outer membrane protein beta-barrel domain
MKFHSAAFRLWLAMFAILAVSVMWPARSRAQDLELSGGWEHATSDFGVDGFNLGAAWFFQPRLAIAAQYDGMWDTTRVGTFEFTSVGAIVAQSHLQDFLAGPRFYFPVYTINGDNNSKRKSNHKVYRLYPFAEAQFGVSHLHQSIQQGIAPAVTNSDSAFSWMLGGGVDYPLTDHWSARGNLDLLRTHLNASAQSRLRLGIGIAYTFGER